VTGLFYQLYPSNRASWAVRYRFNGPSRKLTLDTSPVISLSEARRLAAEALVPVARVVDPQERKIADRAAAQTETQDAADEVGKVLDEFVLRHLTGKRSATEIERLLRKAGLAR
jgi:hypothetical protein